MRKVFVAILLCLAFTCSVHASGGTVGTVEGKITLIGSDPLIHVVLTTNQGGQQWGVTGPVATELRSLGQGYVVRVAGILNDSAAGANSVEAYQFKIMAAKTATGDKKVQVGKIVVTEEDTYLVTSELLIYRLRGSAVDGLRQMPGTRVCVAGAVTNSWTKGPSLKVDFFNVIKQY